MLSDNNESSWRRPAAVGASIVVVLALILAVAYACSSDDEPGAATEAAAEVDLAAPPEQVTWSPYKGIALPVSAVSGPSGQESGAPTGYEQSPQGAALAAIQTTVRISVADDAVWPDLVRVAVAPGAGRDAFSVNRVQVSIQGDADPETKPAIRGYRVAEYAPDTAVVEVVTSYPDESIAQTAVDVIYRDDDWKVVLPDPAESDRSAPTTALTALPDDMVALEASR